MVTKLFVGSLSWNVNDAQLSDFFAPLGKVVSASVVTDRNSGQSKGFGFVEMDSADEAKEAIKQLNGKELDGRTVNVSEAKPREDRPQGGDRNHRSDNRGSYNRPRY